MRWKRRDRNYRQGNGGKGKKKIMKGKRKEMKLRKRKGSKEKRRIEKK